MDISSIQGGMAGQIFRTGTDTDKGAASGGSTLPASWGPDTVSISEEALAAMRTAQETAKKAAANTDAGEENADLSETEQAFADYMTRKRSKASATDSESQLKELEDKLKALESELSAVASKGKTDPATMTQVEQLTSQIEAVTAQIAELMAQMGKKEA